MDSVIDIIRAPIEGYRWLIQQVVILTRDLFAAYGYLVVFLGTFLENTLFLGLIIPGGFVILLAGISAYQGLISFPLALAVGVAGTSLGDTASYLAGRYGWKRALKHTENVPWMGMMRTALLRRTAVFVLAYHFLGYTRLVGPITAGVLHIPFLRWWLLDFTGAVIWVTTYLTIGYLCGRLGFTLDAAEDNLRRLEWLFIALAVLAVTVWLFMRSREANVTESVLEALTDPDEKDAQRSEKH
jgi:membrane protein DedA with SNARE-associated domain